MARKKLTTLNLIKTLQDFDKQYFSFADLKKITGLKEESLKVALTRLTQKGVLIRVKRGIYNLGFSLIELGKIANQLYYPSYLSFESALSKYGILSQIPYTQTFATIRKSKRISLAGTEVEFTQLKKDLFFGYVMEGQMYLALPEKALLDELYLISRGKRSLNLKELNLDKIDRKKLREFLEKYPSSVKKLYEKLY